MLIKLDLIKFNFNYVQIELSESMCAVIRFDKQNKKQIRNVNMCVTFSKEIDSTLSTRVHNIRRQNVHLYQL